MKRPQILTLSIALVFTVVLFLLPKVVVDNQEDPVAEGSATSSEVVQAHDPEVPASRAGEISDLRRLVQESESSEKSAIFADSLAQTFLGLSVLDSAVFYAELAAELNPGEDYWIRAGDVCYEAMSFAVDRTRGEGFGNKARTYYQKILEQSPGRLDLKSKVAMTYVSTSNPMRGIVMLREVLEEDPDNLEAISNLGILSLQSAQYDRAIERFEKLVELNPTDMQAQVLLGVSYKEGGKRAEARNQFEKVMKMTSDSSIMATAESYLEDLK